MRASDVQKTKILLRDSEDYRNYIYTLAMWREYEALWRGDYSLPDMSEDAEGNIVGNNDTLTLPVLVSDAQRQIASLLGADPRVEVYTDDPELLPGARVLSTKLNHMIVTSGLMDELRDAVQDAITLGTGFVMTGFGSQFGTHVDAGVDGFDDSRTDSKGNRIEYHENLADDKPWTLRAHPSEIFIPPGVVRLNNSYGYFHLYQRHKDDIDGDDKLFTKHRHALQPDSAYDNMTHTTNLVRPTGMFSAILGESRDVLCSLVDWIDLRTNHRVTFSPYYPYALRDDVDELLIRLDRLNIEPIIFTPNSRAFWGTADFDLLMPNAKEINDIRTQQMKHRRAQVVKAFIDITGLEIDGEDQEAVDNAVKKLSSDDVAAFVPTNRSPNEMVSFASPSQPYGFPEQLDIAKKEIEMYGTGVGPLQKGQMSTGRHTKYETQSAESYHEQSMTPRRKVVRNAIINSLQAWSKLIFSFWTEPQLCKTYDAAGNPVTVEFRGADLRGDYRFQVSLDSMGARGRGERIEEANMILAQLQPFTEPGPDGIAVVDKRALVQQYVSRLDTNWDIEALLGGASPQQMGPPQQFGQFQQGFMKEQQAQPGVAQMMQQLAGGRGPRPPGPRPPGPRPAQI